MILGIDAGNDQVKVCGEYGLIKFISCIGEAREINLKQVHGEDDLVFTYNGTKGFAGTLAMYESEFSGSIMGESKAHDDTKIRVLLAIHQYCTRHRLPDKKFQIVLGQPIASHTEEEKDKIKRMLRGEHSIEVNGVQLTLHIEDVHIAAEGASSFWSNPKDGLSRIIDVGSGTVNYSTILEGRYIDKDSGTLSFGANTNKTNDIEALTRGIVTQTMKKWNRNDKVYLVGGKAEEIEDSMKRYYPHAEILYPVFNNEFTRPVYANAIAFYIIGVNIYD